MLQFQDDIFRLKERLDEQERRHEKIVNELYTEIEHLKERLNKLEDKTITEE
jgi:tetrahydromethanopterin S-methyltransferase subunit G